MKTILTTMLVLFTLNCTFAQKTATVKNKSEIISIKEAGVGTIVMAGNLTSSEVESKAKYYTQYFSVAYDESTQKATITMIENDDRGRAVIMRFLVACDIQNVKVGDEILTTSEMYVKYLK